MTSARRVLVGAVVWVSVVALGSTMVWTVISRAGRDLVTGQPNPAGATGLSTRSGGDLGLPTTPRPIGRRSHSPSPEPSPDGTPGVSPESPGATTGSGPGAPSSQPGGGSTTAVTDRRTWRGEGGSVELRCQGSSISIVSSFAYPGFQKIIGSDGPEHVEITFVGQEEGEHHEEQVQAGCRADGKLWVEADESEGGESEDD